MNDIQSQTEIDNSVCFFQPTSSLSKIISLNSEERYISAEKNMSCVH